MYLYFKEVGPERGDCTQPYKVSISKKPYTVSTPDGKKILTMLRQTDLEQLFGV